jgi:hypothetical protein
MSSQERFPDLASLQAERAAIFRAEQKAKKREEAKAEKQARLEREEQAKLRSYEYVPNSSNHNLIALTYCPFVHRSLMDQSNMTSNIDMKSDVTDRFAAILLPFIVSIIFL